MGMISKAALIVISVFLMLFCIGMGIAFAKNEYEFKTGYFIPGAVAGFAIALVSIIGILGAALGSRPLLLVYMGVVVVSALFLIGTGGYMIGFVKGTDYDNQFKDTITELHKDKGAFDAVFKILQEQLGKCCGCKIAPRLDPCKDSTQVPATGNSTQVLELYSSVPQATTQNPNNDCCKMFSELLSNMMIIMAAILFGLAGLELVAALLAFFVFKDASILPIGPI